MCEPHHSIVQFPPQDDDNPYSDLPGGRLGMVLGKVARVGKKVRGWFHLSRMGAGHSEATQQIFGRVDLPGFNSLEVAWWKRQTRFDFPSINRSDEAWSAAREYAERTSIGHIQTLRRFLEESITHSDRPWSYWEQMRQMLMPAGISQLEEKTRRVIGDKICRPSSFARISLSPKLQRQLANCIVGLTRQRNLLTPVWADENRLWLPRGGSS